MRIAYFDCIGGISGDMILGALVDAGVPAEGLRQMVSSLPVKGVHIEAGRVPHRGITATRVRVHSAEAHPHRVFSEIADIIQRSQLADSVKKTSIRVFGRIAEAEAKIHGVPVDEIHFHEVGAVDAIVDVVGAVWGLEHLRIGAVYASPIKLGRGTTTSLHGPIPIPAPATVELVKGFPVVETEIAAELSTPTGVAILTTLAGAYRPLPEFRLEAIGYGAGSRELGELPNVLRVMVGEAPLPTERDDLVLIETNIDDMEPEFYPYIIDQLFEDGAMDVYLTPVIMKKGRPGTVVSVLVDRSRVEGILSSLYRETTTLGVRIFPVARRKLPREIVDVETTLGRMKAKLVEWEGKQRLVPEYEECRRVALEKKIPLREVYEAVRKLNP